MQVIASTSNHVPIMVIQGAPKDWAKAFGASMNVVPGALVIPAYYPLGLTSLRELESVSRGKLELNTEAQTLVSYLQKADIASKRAAEQLRTGKPVDLELPVGWRWHKNAPYQHQRYGIQIGLDWWRHMYLWEMGTGKTKVAVETWRIRKAIGTFRGVLVLCPRVVVPTWLREIAEHSDGELTSWEWDCQDPRRLENASKVDVVVATYAAARMEADSALISRTTLRDNKKLSEEEKTTLQASASDPLAALDRGEIYADESHCMGSWESKQTRAVVLLSSNKARRMCLSGTAADQPAKLFGQLKFLAPALMPKDYAKFLQDHLIFSKEPGRRLVPVGYKGIQWLNEQVSHVASRMLKDDCLDLPPRTIVDVPFALNPLQAARYNELADEWIVSAVPGLLIDPTGQATEGDAGIEVLMEMPHAATRLAKVLQVTSGFIIINEADVDKPMGPKKLLRDFGNPKLEAMEALLSNILDGDLDSKVICWANLTPELDDLESLCKKAGYGYERLDGKSTRRVGGIEERFQTDPNCRVIVGMTSVGVGITLTAANFMVYYAPPWNRVHYRQSRDRNHRPGQKRKTTVYRMVGVGTVEAAVLRVLERKEDLARMLTAKVDCTKCEHEARCGAIGTVPFAEGCVFQPEFSRPLVRVEAVYGHRPEKI